MTPPLARSLWECNGVERDAFRQHRGTFVVPATGWWTSCSKAQRWTACSRAPDYMPQSGLKPATVPCALTPLCERRPRSTVGVIGVFGAQAALHVFAAGVDPTPQATHSCCKRLRPSIITCRRRRSQQDVVCALIVEHADYGAAPPAPFEHPAALQLRTGARGVGASWLTHAHSRHCRVPAS